VAHLLTPGKEEAMAKAKKPAKKTTKSKAKKKK
jgi:hypothetical protein